MRYGPDPPRASAPPFVFLLSLRLTYGRNQDWADELRVVGSHPQLGAWDPSQAPALSREGGEWAVEVGFDVGAEFEFKLVANGDNWEEIGDNRHFTVVDAQCAHPASTAARTGQVVTRQTHGIDAFAGNRTRGCFSRASERRHQG